MSVSRRLGSIALLGIEIFVPGLHTLRSKPWRLVLLSHLGFILNNYFLLPRMHLYVCVCVYIFLLFKSFFPSPQARISLSTYTGMLQTSVRFGLCVRWEIGSTRKGVTTREMVRSHSCGFILFINLKYTAHNLSLLLKSCMNQTYTI